MPEVPTANSTDFSCPTYRSRSIRRNIEYSPAIAAALVAVSDLLTIWFVTYVAFLSGAGAHRLQFARYIAVFVSTAAIIQVAFGYFELYDLNILDYPTGRLPRITAGCCLALPISYLGMLSFSPSHSLTWCFAFVLLLIATLYAERWIAYATIHSLTQRGLITRNTVIIGCDPQCSHLLRELLEVRRPWTRILGIFDDRTEPASIIEGRPWLGTTDSLIDFARRVRVDDVFLALPRAAEADVHKVIEKLRILAVNVHLRPELNHPSLISDSFFWQDNVHAFRLASKPLDGWKAIIKTIEDKIVAAFALLLMLPVLAMVALAIRLESPGPVLFRQRRFGRNNQIIEIYKFRTMFNDQRDDNAERLTTKGDPRVTPLGRFLRRASIDELPQLLNVLRGDMSVVGPRPHAINARSNGKLYAEVVARYAERYKIKPGITGWAQVSGWRGDTDSEQGLRRRVEFDIYYMEHWSILFDIYVMLRTPLIMLSGKGAC
jgi:Undecaprenyl-phosphate glucose phosphotransferase